MARFAHMFLDYVMYVANEKVMLVRDFDQKPAKGVVKYCKILIERYEELAAFYPCDERVVGLAEWKAYLENPFDLRVLGQLCKAIGDLGIDPNVIYQYVKMLAKVNREEERLMENMDESDNPAPFKPYMASTELVKLFGFRFPPDHIYHVMRDALFDVKDKRVLDAFNEIYGRSKEKRMWLIEGPEGGVLRKLKDIY